MTKIIVGAAGAISLVALAGCGVAAPSAGQSGETGETGQALLASNGEMQNGEMQNGEMQNGEMQNGIAMALTGVNLTTMHRLLHQPAPGSDPDVSDANLVAVANARLDRTTLTDGTHTGAWFKGTVVKGNFSDGQIGWVYLADIVPSADDPEITHYTLRAQHRFHPQPGIYCIGGCPLIWDEVCG